MDHNCELQMQLSQADGWSDQEARFAHALTAIELIDGFPGIVTVVGAALEAKSADLIDAALRELTSDARPEAHLCCVDGYGVVFIARADQTGGEVENLAIIAPGLIGIRKPRDQGSIHHRLRQSWPSVKRHSPRSKAP
jgi:hypothetical protein